MGAAAGADRDDREGWGAHRDRRTRSELPIVVGGCHRSGTSLVRRLLDSHSRISCGPELKFLIDFHDEYTTEDPLRHARFATTAIELAGEQRAFDILGRAFLETHRAVAREAGKLRWADKNPENVLYAEAWERLLGDDWLFVHVHREMDEALASMEKAGFPYRGPDRAERRAAHWRRYVSAGARLARRRGDRGLQLSYEALTAEPAETLALLMRFCGEEPEPQQLELDPGRHRAGLEDPSIASKRRIEPSAAPRLREIGTEAACAGAAAADPRRLRRAV